MELWRRWSAARAWERFTWRPRWLSRLGNWYDQLTNLQQVGAGALAMVLLLSTSLYFLGLGSMVLAHRARDARAQSIATYWPPTPAALESPTTVLPPIVDGPTAPPIASQTVRPTPTLIPPPVVEPVVPKPRPRPPAPTRTPTSGPAMEATPAVVSTPTPVATGTKPRIGPTTQPTLLVQPTPGPPRTSVPTPTVAGIPVQPTATAAPAMAPTASMNGGPIRTPTPSR